MQTQLPFDLGSLPSVFTRFSKTTVEKLARVVATRQSLALPSCTHITFSIMDSPPTSQVRQTLIQDVRLDFVAENLRL